MTTANESRTARTTELRLKTDLRCKSCVETLRPHMDAAEDVVQSWDVDVTSADKMLTVAGDADARTLRDAATRAVEDAGYHVLGETTPAPTPAPSHSHGDAATDDGLPTTYYPLVLIVGFLVGIVALVEVASAGVDWGRAMRHFMAGFFLAFGFFKLLDVRGFVDAFRMYDIVGKRVPAYAWAYPFIEVTLGAAYLTNFMPVTTNVVTLLVMSVGAVGVLRTLLDGRRIRCACLGTVFNLPMTTVTLVEDLLMAGMAAMMLVMLASGHGAANAHPDHARHADHVHAVRPAVRPADELIVSPAGLHPEGEVSQSRLIVNTLFVVTPHSRSKGAST